MKKTFGLGLLLLVLFLVVFVLGVSQVLAERQADLSADTGVDQPASPNQPLEDGVINLPLILKDSPFIPDAPVLSVIDNADGNGNYTVSWGGVVGALSYTLEEDETADFSSPTAVYTGTSTFFAIRERDIGTYFYRVKASNVYFSSAWSNIQSAVVTVPLPQCPQEGNWYGTTSEGYDIHFAVQDSPYCQITTGSLSVQVYLNCGTSTTLYTIEFATTPLITNNHFATGNADNMVTGDFSTPILASGTYHLTPVAGCSTTGTWKAAPNGANSTVYALAAQPDGKILVGGKFSMLGGEAHAQIGRINADGTLDTSFTAAVGGDTLYGLSVRALAVQANNKILVGGAFTRLNGITRNYIGRLNADGTLDLDFNPRADNLVEVLVEQADHKILVGGRFSELGGEPRSRIGRVNADGTLDLGFDPIADGTVFALAEQDDNKILVGGQFTELVGQTRNNIARLNPTGALDVDFNPNANGVVNALVVLPDNKILIGGGFTSVGGVPRNYIARLNPNGSLDTGFDPGANGAIEDILIQPDGKILIGGYFTQFGGATHYRIARLNANGTLDTTFTPGADGVWAYSSVRALAVKPNGYIVAGGDFTELNAEWRNFLGWLEPDGDLGIPIP
jgi:uncharacterized delta-60 repeat protein